MSQSSPSPSPTADKTPSVVYEAVANFRAQFRKDSIPSDYSPYWHFGLINAGAIIGCTGFWALGQGIESWIRDPMCVFVILFAFFLCNFFEYRTHRYNLHNPLVHTRHSHIHHRFFTDRVMQFETLRDAHTIFFPEKAPFFIVPFSYVLASPVALIFGLNRGAAFGFVLLGYYFLYEWLHLSYHAPSSSWLGSLPGVAYLRRHHQIHHSQALMNKYNFNITFPIADAIFGTTYKGGEDVKPFTQ